jgi:hypothetical protein
MKMTYRLLLFLAAATTLRSCAVVQGVNVRTNYGNYNITPDGQITVDLTSDK